MSDVNLARRAEISVSFAGVNISSSIRNYLVSLAYTDNESGNSDDLQIVLHDREGIWMEEWLGEAIDSASAAKLKITAEITRQNWVGDGKDETLKCGEFELDTVDCSGPPASVTIKASSLPFSSAIRQTLKSKGWEKYNLSGIAREMASGNGMTLRYDASADPYYDRKEQTATSDISFLYKLCTDAGLALKATGKEIVIFDQQKYESQPAVMTITKRKEASYNGANAYVSYRLSSGSASKQYASCRVSWVNDKGQLLEGIAKVDDYNEDSKTNQQLEIKEKVTSAAEARTLAEKRLRHANLYAKTAEFVMPGNPVLCAGVTVALKGWGSYDGKYLCSTAKHTVQPGSGYQTSISLRRILEGY